MYCPKCGQEIASSDLRFCPRCGLALAAVSQLLTGGSLVRSSDEPPATGLRILRRREYRTPAKLIYFSLFSLPFALALSIIFDAPGPFVFPLILFLAGVFILGYRMLFGRGWRAADESRPALRDREPNALPEHREYISPIETSGRVTTDQLREPPSVTEPTTKLL